MRRPTQTHHKKPCKVTCWLTVWIHLGMWIEQIVQTPSGMFSILLQVHLEEDCPSLISTAITVDKKILIYHCTWSQETKRVEQSCRLRRKERLVILSGKFTFKLKIKVSFTEFQVSPRALEHSSGWISKLEVFPTQFEEIRESTSGKLERHFLKWNPLASNNLRKCFYRSDCLLT
ncbi:hypothetical protein TNCT_699291 [Trichonephila clavata]|uniref:Uncharacterized protein n=1 Tax=Trichonephila clavata TaxID=2740835 RepID=A0A8X6FRS2_TRICU|nr:hypothetical protein TNCT_699291 [Trichonephila clavata]